MRVLHTADWHFGKMLEGRSRLDEQAAFVDELVRIADEENVDVVLMAGDAYDTVNPPAAAEQLFYEAVSRLSDGARRPVAAIAGNHDHPDRLSASGPLAARQGITLLGLPGHGAFAVDAKRTGERMMLYALPYPSEARLNELLTGETDEAELQKAYSVRIGELVAAEAAKAFRQGTVNVVMSHLFAAGGRESEGSERPIQVGGAYTVHPETLCAGSPHYVALGHLHRAQTLDASSIVRYSGSPIAYSFSEAGQAKSVTIADLAPGAQPVLSEIVLSSGRPLVRWNAKGGMLEVQRWIEEGRDSRAWIDLEVHVTEALSMESIHTLRKTHAGIVSIRPIFPEMARLAAELARADQVPVDELFRRFYMKQTGGAEPEPELVGLFLELLEEQDAAGGEGNL